MPNFTFDSLNILVEVAALEGHSVLVLCYPGESNVPHPEASGINRLCYCKLG